MQIFNIVNAMYTLMQSANNIDKMDCDYSSMIPVDIINPFGAQKMKLTGDIEEHSLLSLYRPAGLESPIGGFFHPF